MRHRRPGLNSYKISTLKKIGKNLEATPHPLQAIRTGWEHKQTLHSLKRPLAQSIATQNMHSRERAKDASHMKHGVVC